RARRCVRDSSTPPHSSAPHQGRCGLCSVRGRLPGLPRFVQAGECGEVSRGAGRRLRATTVGFLGTRTDGRQELATAIAPLPLARPLAPRNALGASARGGSPRARARGLLPLPPRFPPIPAPSLTT